MKIIVKITAISLLLTLVGCTHRIVDFTIISTKNVDLSRGAEFQRARNRVTGEDPAYIIIFIPTGIPNLKEAIDRAIESVPGAVALLDGVVSRRSFYIPFIFGEDSFVVEGKALIDPMQAAQSDTTFSDYNIVRLDEEGNIEKLDHVSEQEYMDIKARVITPKS